MQVPVALETMPLQVKSSEERCRSLARGGMLNHKEDWLFSSSELSPTHLACSHWEPDTQPLFFGGSHFTSYSEQWPGP